jgi:hypothetical protein
MGAGWAMRLAWPWALVVGVVLLGVVEEAPNYVV